MLLHLKILSCGNLVLIYCSTNMSSKFTLCNMIVAYMYKSLCFSKFQMFVGLNSEVDCESSQIFIRVIVLYKMFLKKLMSYTSKEHVLCTLPHVGKCHSTI